MGKIEGLVWMLTVYCKTPAHPWVEGELEKTLPDRSSVKVNYTFQAKIYDEGSKFGINKGRISKLMIWKNEHGRGNFNKNIIANYDRGWDIQPKNEMDKEALQRILLGLEDMPYSSI
jgi:hypothetical protein